MKLLAIAIVAAALLVAAVSTAEAKGTLTVDPTTVPRGSTFELSGCGYPAPTAVVFRVRGPGTDYFTADTPVPESCFTQTMTAWWDDAGEYSITSYYRDAKGALRKVTVVKFTVT